MVGSLSERVQLEQRMLVVNEHSEQELGVERR